MKIMFGIFELAIGLVGAFGSGLVIVTGTTATIPIPTMFLMFLLFSMLVINGGLILGEK